MRDFDAKDIVRALLDGLKTIEIAHPEALEPISKAFGYDNWNILSAKIKAAEQPASDERTLPVGPQNDQTTLYCTFCGKSQHEVRKLIAGPTAFICDECVDLCTNIIETDDDLELFRLMKASEESGTTPYPRLLELARRMPTEELADDVELGRKGVERIRAALQAIERSRRDGEVSADEAQQTAQRDLKRYEDVLGIAKTVLGDRRQ